MAKGIFEDEALSKVSPLVLARPLREHLARLLVDEPGRVEETLRLSKDAVYAALTGRAVRSGTRQVIEHFLAKEK